MQAKKIQLLERGEIAKPGDFADKWAYNKNAPRKVGKAVYTRKRFEIFAKWCVDKYDDKSKQNRLKIIDIAGGGGKLSSELTKLD